MIANEAMNAKRLQNYKKQRKTAIFSAFFMAQTKKKTILLCHVAEKPYLCAVKTDALVVELVDTPDLGSGAARRVSSSLIRRTHFSEAVGREKMTL